VAVAPRTSAAALKAAALSAVLLLAGCERPPAVAAAAAPSAPVAAVPGPAETLAALDGAIAAARADSARFPQSWTALEQLSALYLQRQQLSGDYAEFDAARAALEAARQRAGQDGVVCATQARLEFALHRLAAAAAALDLCRQRFGLSADTVAELAGIEAEIALYQGRYEEALAGLRAALEFEETIPALARLSRYHARTGRRVEALALLDRAERRYFGDAGQLRAWLQLQRAIIELESGRWEDARAYLRAADRLFPGWWLVQEHLAEVEALLGDSESARARYRAVVETTGLPEYLDAWAALEQAGGQPAAAAALRARAAAAFETRLARWPEAAAGHALDHFLQPGSDPKRALALAEANVRARPYAESQIQLARAQLLAGQPRAAQRVLDAVARTPWRSAEQYWLAAHSLAALGEKRRAAEARRQALLLNPRAAEQYAVPSGT